MRLKFVLTMSALVLVGTVYFAATVMATPSQGFFATTLAKGTLGEVNVFNHEVLDTPASGKPPGSNAWVSLQKTQGTSDLYVQSNLWVPGGSTGWHTHPGHSLITVTEGAVTVYESNDPNCAPRVYTPGMTFVDEGGDHVHLIRNEGAVDAKTIAVQLIPAGAVRRIDAPTPSNCSF